VTDSVHRTKYADAVAAFHIEDAIGNLQGDMETGLNACIECCDRHCGNDRIALRYIAADGRLEIFTFEQLRDMSAKIATMLEAAGVVAGDVVAGLLPRTPELIATVLGTWRTGAAYQPLFTAFGPKAIDHRLRTSKARLVVTNAANREKLSDIEYSPIVATLGVPGVELVPGDIDLREALAGERVEYMPVLRGADDLLFMMSTSGTTGFPKGVPVPMRALLSFGIYMRDAVDLRPEDVFWNIADPGWAYGLYYAVTGPLLLGQATTFYEGSFSVQALCDTILRLGVTNLAGSPTAYRALMAAPAEIAASIAGRLRVVSSAGEPLNPEVVRWFAKILGAPIHDHYGQTELGMVVNNHHRLEHIVRPGSAGFAMPGYRVVVLGEAGDELGPNQPGALAIDIARSPLLWFTGYHEQPTPAISGGYYNTGDNVEFEPDGSISFIGRSDDVITSSGYRIGPFDVESALIEHPAVMEVAVIGVPDPERTEIVKAFVVLADGYQPGSALAEELRLHVRNHLSAHAYPRAIEFLDELPKTPSGKVQRFILRKAEAEKSGKD